MNWTKTLQVCTGRNSWFLNRSWFLWVLTAIDCYHTHIYTHSQTENVPVWLVICSYLTEIINITRVFLLLCPPTTWKLWTVVQFAAAVVTLGSQREEGTITQQLLGFFFFCASGVVFVELGRSVCCSLQLRLCILALLTWAVAPPSLSTPTSIKGHL